MKILNFGSLNLDMVYTVPHFAAPGETLSALRLETLCGGKGLNQSIAMARAGAQVWHAGCVGAADGGMLVDELERAGVNTSLVRRLDCPSGHAIIQVDQSGQNSILLFGGANRAITPEQVEQTLAQFAPGDLLVLQNEISSLPYLLAAAQERGLDVALNPSPMTDDLLELPLEAVRYFFVNEIEASQLCGGETDESRCLELLLERYPGSRVILTLGARGCVYQDAHRRLTAPARPVQAVDTTAAGDTFSGYFLACAASGAPVEQALDIATRAAAIAVCRRGAAPSIPAMEEILGCGA